MKKKAMLYTVAIFFCFSFLSASANITISWSDKTGPHQLVLACDKEAIATTSAYPDFTAIQNTNDRKRTDEEMEKELFEQLDSAVANNLIHYAIKGKYIFLISYSDDFF
jgi:hypothetical protein